MRLRTRRAVARSAVVLLGALAMLPWLQGMGAADADGSYDAMAAAQGMRVSVEQRGYVIVESEEVAPGPAAWALINDLGNSTAYAAIPYPGATAISARGLIASKLPAGAPQPPNYPMYVGTSYPARTEANGEDPDINSPCSPQTSCALRARSDEFVSSGLAEAGSKTTDQTAAHTKTIALVERVTNGEVRADAETIVEGISAAGGTIRIGKIRSFSKVQAGSAPTPTLESGLEITGFSAAGQSIGLTDKGLVVGGTTTPLPGSPVAEALRAQGVTVALMSPIRDADGSGVTSASLEIRVVRRIEGVGTAPATLVYSIGRSSARASSSPAKAKSESGGGIIFGGPTGGSLSSPNTSGPSLVQSPPSAISPPSAPANGGVAPTANVMAIDRNSLTGIYLVLVVGGLAVLGGTILIRYLGVRLGMAR